MGSYDQRPVEMRRLLTAATANGTGPAFARLDAAVTRWGETRETLLDRLVAMAAAARTGDPARLAEDWVAATKAGRAELKAILTDGAKDLVLPLPVQAWWMAALVAEDGFLDQLGQLPTLSLIGKLRSQRMTMEIMQAHLEKKWSALTDLTATFRTPQMQAIDEIEKMALAILAEQETALKKIGEEAGKLYEENKAKLDEGVRKFGEGVIDVALEAAAFVAGLFGANTEGLPAGVKSMAGHFDGYLGLAKINNDARLYKIRLYKESLRSQGHILNMFMEERRLVAEYDRTNGVEGARNHKLGIQTTAEKFASTRPTDGQKADATVLAQFLTEAGEEVFEETCEVDEAFRDRFSGLFVDPISDTTFEALTSVSQFEQIMAELDALEIGEKLDARASAAPQIFYDAVDDAFSEVEAAVEQYPVEARDLLFMKSREQHARVRAALKVKLDEMTAISTDIAKRIYPGEINGEFDRSELSDRLR